MRKINIVCTFPLMIIMLFYNALSLETLALINHNHNVFFNSDISPTSLASVSAWRKETQLWKNVKSSFAKLDPHSRSPADMNTTRTCSTSMFSTKCLEENVPIISLKTTIISTHQAPCFMSGLL